MPIFPLEVLQSLLTPGIAERWAAVQSDLHPRLLMLAEVVHKAATVRFPREWPLYESSFKSQRYVNRGHGEREPIDDYWVAFDRPPRGAGILLSVSSAERTVTVGIQLWKARKRELQTIWEEGRAFWQPLIERIAQEGEARYAERDDRRRIEGALWLDRYLEQRAASYLWAGFVYPWDSLPEDLDVRLVDDVLTLFPLNEALMEQAEARDPAAALLLRERRSSYDGGLPPIETIVERIHARGFTLNELTIRAYHVALQTRPFVVLPGISGTGKTRLTRLYADAVYDIDPGKENPYYLNVAVQPDWHNARDLLGYYNALNSVYHPTPFLRFLLQAAADPQQLYFVCLDEMNLARPEYYLAPLLSAMETIEQTFDIAAPTSEVTTVSGELLRNPLRLPPNLRLIGTVNVDESTYILSDKLLDRANVIELTNVDLETFRATYRDPIDDETWRLIRIVHASATEAGHPFGYRTIGEMLRFVQQAQGSLTPRQALDVQIKQRVLPKLRGEDAPRLRRALNELLALSLGLDQSVWQRAAQVSAAQLATAPYPESATKLRHMLERLDQDGFTDFYG
jgi:MoxR-like ATPase